MTAQLVQLPSTPDLADRVYRALLDAISAGTLAPGQRIKQEELAERLAVSRQPVLQALRLLKRDGFVQDAPLAGSSGGRSRGLQVAPVDPSWIAQLYDVRSALDALAARRAAERQAVIDASLIERGRQAVRDRNIPAMIDADFAFHQAVYEASGNPLIAQSAQVQWQHIRRAMGESLRLNPLHDAVWDEHEAIAQAISRGNARSAEAVMRRHCEQAGLHHGEKLRAAMNTPTP
jgi:DNA-binding GntR family transcriptional regulator